MSNTSEVGSQLDDATIIQGSQIDELAGESGYDGVVGSGVADNEGERAEAGTAEKKDEEEVEEENVDEMAEELGVEENWREETYKFSELSGILFVRLRLTDIYLLVCVVARRGAKDSVDAEVSNWYCIDMNQTLIIDDLKQYKLRVCYYLMISIRMLNGTSMLQWDGYSQDDDS